MPDITTSLSRSSFLPTSGEASTNNTTILLQGLMEGLGWHDQRADIYAVEAEQQILDQQLKSTLEHYLETQDAHHKDRLMAALQQALEKAQADVAYALQQQAYYQAQSEREGKEAFSLSYVGQWKAWVLQGVKGFFGSTAEQLVEKYTAAADTHRNLSAQLTRCLESLQAEKMSVPSSEQETSESYLETTPAHSNQRRLLSTTTLTAASFPAVISLADLNGQNGFKLDGEPQNKTQNEYNGFSVSRAGDINGDGFDDLIIGAPGISRSYIVFGVPEIGSNGLLALSNLNGTNGFKLNGEAGDASGRSVSAAGDINGDGHDDLLIGAPQYAGYTGCS